MIKNPKSEIRSIRQAQDKNTKRKIRVEQLPSKSTKKLRDKKVVVERVLRDSYLAFIKNSVGSRSWQNWYVKVNGKKIDATEGGNKSCSYFATSILYLFGLIDSLHGTTWRTEEEMLKTGWKRIPTSMAKEGDVIVWEEVEFPKAGPVPHMGFYLGDKRAVSTSMQRKIVTRHHYTYGGKRKIAAFYRHPRVNPGS